MRKLALILLGIAALTACQDKQIKGEVVGKYEENGRCYIDLQMEIPIDDYIGLEIGDEYEIGGIKSD